MVFRFTRALDQQDSKLMGSVSIIAEKIVLISCKKIITW
jgi:hypothetical protein